MMTTRLRRSAQSVFLCAGLVTAGLTAVATPAFAVGAIAVDDEAGQTGKDAGYGIGHGEDRRSAEHDALRECRKAGNDSCKVAVWYKNCGAYAASRNYFGIGYGDSEDVAKHKALEDCAKDGCHIVVSDCDD